MVYELGCSAMKGELLRCGDGMSDRDSIKFIGTSPAFLQALKLIKRFAVCATTVLILGETGTGKELAARSIHYHSDRYDQPFVPVNCGALPDSLVESEFFGHVGGGLHRRS
jgi:transcriptional regulator with PAS, ATPase and Fis domain